MAVRYIITSEQDIITTLQNKKGVVIVQDLQSVLDIVDLGDVVLFRDMPQINIFSVLRALKRLIEKRIQVLYLRDTSSNKPIERYLFSFLGLSIIEDDYYYTDYGFEDLEDMLEEVEVGTTPIKQSIQDLKKYMHTLLQDSEQKERLLQVCDTLLEQGEIDQVKMLELVNLLLIYDNTKETETKVLQDELKLCKEKVEKMESGDNSVLELPNNNITIPYFKNINTQHYILNVKDYGMCVGLTSFCLGMQKHLQEKGSLVKLFILVDDKENLLDRYENIPKITFSNYKNVETKNKLQKGNVFVLVSATKKMLEFIFTAGHRISIVLDKLQLENAFIQGYNVKEVAGFSSLSQLDKYRKRSRVTDQKILSVLPMGYYLEDMERNLPENTIILENFKKDYPKDEVSRFIKMSSYYGEIYDRLIIVLQKGV